MWLTVKQTLLQFICVSHSGADAGQSNHVTKARLCFLALILEMKLSSEVLLAFIIKLSDPEIVSSFSFVLVSHSL